MAVMKYNERRSRYEWHGSYDERLEPKAARFRWDPDNRLWWTDDPEKAAKLREFADDSALGRLPDGGVTVRQSRDMSRASSSDFEVPAPEGLEYMPFQRAGIEYALQRDGCLIGDEMGLGKTIQAIGVANATEDAKRVLVVCPASLKLNWQRELEKWLVRPMSVGVANGQGFPRTDVVVINYDVLKKHHSAIRATDWDLLIVDECQYVKNRKAQRTQEVWGKLKRDKSTHEWTWDPTPIQAKRRLALTGTPIVNRPVELYPVLNGLDSRTWRSFNRFALRYCDAKKTRWGWDYTGASNLDELQQLLRTSVMVRRLKKDVLKELPAKVRQVIELPADGISQKVITEEWAAFEQRKQMIDRLQNAVASAAKAKDKAAYADAVAELKEAQAAAFAEMSRVRHQTAVSKVPYVVEHLLDVLESTDKLVVFAHHHDVVDEILIAMRKAGHETVVLTGRESQAQKDAAVQAFQRGDAKVFIGNIIAAGVGLTLTAGSHVVFAELDWVPGNITQAEDRCHRFGQRDSVLVQHLVLEGSLDAYMAHKIVQKQRVMDAALDDEQPEAPQPDNEPEKTPANVVELGSELFQSVVHLMDHAHDKGLAYPKIRLVTDSGQKVQLSRATEHSRFPGHVWVGDGSRGGLFFGRVDPDGRFHKSRDCDGETGAEVVELLKRFATDPIGQAKLFAKLTGRCCFCGLELTDARSVTVGYGPICAGKYGLPWGDHAEETTVEVPLKG